MENFEQNQDCITRPYPYEVEKPILDSLNGASFFPDSGGMLFLKGQYQDEKLFAVDFGIQTEFSKGCLLSVSPFSNIKEQLKFLKDLNRMTFDAIKFIERNNLKQKY